MNDKSLLNKVLQKIIEEYLKLKERIFAGQTSNISSSQTANQQMLEITPSGLKIAVSRMSDVLIALQKGNVVLGTFNGEGFDISDSRDIPEAEKSDYLYLDVERKALYAYFEGQYVSINAMIDKVVLKSEKKQNEFSFYHNYDKTRLNFIIGTKVIFNHVVKDYSKLDFRDVHLVDSNLNEATSSSKNSLCYKFELFQKILSPIDFQNSEFADNQQLLNESISDSVWFDFYNATADVFAIFDVTFIPISSGAFDVKFFFKGITELKTINSSSDAKDWDYCYFEVYDDSSFSTKLSESLYSIDFKEKQYLKNIPYGVLPTVTYLPTEEKYAYYFSNWKRIYNLKYTDVSENDIFTAGSTLKCYLCYSVDGSPVIRFAPTEKTNQNVRVNIDYANVLGYANYYISSIDNQERPYSNGVEVSTNCSITAFYKSINDGSILAESATFVEITNIDKDAPHIPSCFYEPTSGTLDPVTATFSYWPDSDLADNGRQYKIGDNGEWMTYSDDLKVPIKSNMTIYARARDDVGNYSEIASARITNIEKFDNPISFMQSIPNDIPTKQDVIVSAIFNNKIGDQNFILSGVGNEFQQIEIDWPNQNQTSQITALIVSDNVELSAQTRRPVVVDSITYYLSSEISSWNVTNIDKVPPAEPMILLSASSDNEYLIKDVDSMTFTINYYDADVKEYVLSNSNDIHRYSSPITVSDNCSLSAWCYDEAGNKSNVVSSEISNFIPLVIDNTTLDAILTFKSSDS